MEVLRFTTGQTGVAGNAHPCLFNNLKDESENERRVDSVSPLFHRIVHETDFTGTKKLKRVLLTSKGWCQYILDAGG